jgi:hypothetical protein
MFVPLFGLLQRDPLQAMLSSDLPCTAAHSMT